MHYNPNTHNYAEEYFTTVALQNGVISFNIHPNVGISAINSISYSTDNGETWTTTQNQNGKGDYLVISVNVNTGDNVLWKGDAQQVGSDEDWGSFFSSTVKFDVKGNIMSLSRGDNFVNDTTLYGSDFAKLFYNFDSNEPCKVVNAKNLILPSMVMETNSYREMFMNCTSLISTPELPATTLAMYCYCSMFSGCTKLIVAPVLPATTLASGCYLAMFSGCTNLVTAPVLPATTLAEYCYNAMFYGCTGLVTAPSLPATTLAESCYSNMFSGCTGLTLAPVLPATTLASTCYYNMFSGCTSLVNAPQLPATTLVQNCYNRMFSDCTSLVNAPTLPATSLELCCYKEMFKNCTVLAVSPELPSTTLANACYMDMFSGTNVLPDCTHINFESESVVASGGLIGLFAGTKIDDNALFNILPKTNNDESILPVMTLSNSCYQGMFRGCVNLETAPLLPATTLQKNCYANMFYGCTSLTTSPELPAITLVDTCYRNMFSDCSNLNIIRMYATDVSANNCLNGWVYNVASTGTFYKNDSASWTNHGVDGVPDGWNIIRVTPQL